WTPSLPSTVPKANEEYEAVYEADENNKGRPDSGETKVTLTVTSGHGLDGDAEKTEVKLENLLPGLTFTAPTPVDTDNDGVVFTRSEERRVGTGRNARAEDEAV